MLIRRANFERELDRAYSQGRRDEHATTMDKLRELRDAATELTSQLMLGLVIEYIGQQQL